MNRYRYELISTYYTLFDAKKQGILRENRAI